MNFWKGLVVALLGLIILFHIAAVWVVHDEHYELTAKDYYDREIRYEETLEQRRAATSLSWDLAFGPNRDEVQLRVRDAEGQPKALETVKLALLRPNSAAQDREITLTPGERGEYQARFTPLQKGRWNATISAQNQGRTLQHRIRLALP